MRFMGQVYTHIQMRGRAARSERASSRRASRRFGRVLAGALLGLLLSQPAPEPAHALSPGFVTVHQNESALLHRRIAPELLAKLLVWDARLSTWRPAQPSETAGVAPGPPPTVLILHLWADWCGPCREEFPVVRDLASDIEQKSAGRARFALLSETASSSAMQTFLDQNQGRMPRGLQYLDTGEGVAEQLRTELAAPWVLPVTLVLDEQRVVRHAVVGKVAGRRDELRDAVTRLLALSSAAPAAQTTSARPAHPHRSNKNPQP